MNFTTQETLEVVCKRIFPRYPHDAAPLPLGVWIKLFVVSVVGLDTRAVPPRSKLTPESLAPKST